MIAFHGSMFPPLLDSLRLATYDLPGAAAIRMMQRNGVTRVLIHRDLMSADSARFLVGAFLRDGDTILFQTPNSTVMGLKR